MKLALAEKSQPPHLAKPKKYIYFPKVVIKSYPSGNKYQVQKYW